MKKPNEVKNIFVDLDVLLDTRITTLSFINNKICYDSLISGDYHNRNRDVFGKIPSTFFERMYSTRDKKILLLSELTFLYYDIIELCLEIQVANESTDPLKIYLNVYPYILDKNELDNLKNKIFDNMLDNIEIIIVSKSIPELTTSWIFDNIGSIFKYDALRWLDYHLAMGQMYKNIILDVSLYAPKLISGPVKDKDITESMFSTLVTAVGTLISLELLEPASFSLYIQKNKKKE